MHDLIRAILRGGNRLDWPGGDEDQFFALCVNEGLVGLVERRLRSATSAGHWPPTLLARLKAASLELAVVSAFRERELKRVIDALAVAGVRPLVIKGAALARTHYPDPALRPSGDADILVRQEDVAISHDALERAGYRHLNETAGALVTYQHHFIAAERRDISLMVDLHWRLNNPQVFANVLSYEELEREAVSIPELGSDARTLGAVHALFHAVVHRVAHQTVGMDLLTISDIHLLASQLSVGELQRFAALTIERRVSAIALDGLQSAMDGFGTKVPQTVIDRLAERAVRRDEPSAVYLRRQLRPVDVLMSDLGAIGTWRERARLIREHLLPSATYMLRAYGVQSRALLPGLYAHRILLGARRWFTAGRPSQIRRR